MAKKTRTELSTLAINTNLPDNTQELITPTTERSQLTDERESVVNYKDDLGGVPNAGKFLTVATDGESLTMVDEPSGVPDWVTFVTALVNQMILKAGGDGTGTTQSTLKFTSYDGTLSAQINFNGIDGNLYINATNSQISLTSQINFVQGGSTTLRLETTGDITHQGNIMALNAQQSFNNNPLYTFKFQGKITGPSGGSFTFEEFANIKGGKENATENDKAGYLSFTTGIADGTLTERLRISSGGNVGIGGITSPTYRIEANTTSGGNGIKILRGGDSMFEEFQGTTGVVSLAASGSGGSFSFRTGTTVGTTTPRLTISSGGVVSIPNGIVFNNNTTGGTPNATGVTLNDYEEGTWTPSLLDATSTTIYSASYVRIGKKLIIECYVTNITNTSSSGSTFTITGLPFSRNQSGTSESFGGGSISLNNGLDLSNYRLLIGGTSGNNYLYFNKVDITGSNQLTVSQANALTGVLIQFTYFL